jgi:hypothetical protein
VNPLNKTFIRPKNMAPIYRIPLLTEFGCNLVWGNTDIVLKPQLKSARQSTKYQAIYAAHDVKASS